MHGNKPFRVVSVFDASLDSEAMGGLPKVVEYTQTRDPDMPKAREGEQLMWFTLSRLSEDDMEYCEQAPSDQQRAIRAFTYGVTQVEGAKTTQGKTEPIMSPCGTRQLAGREAPYWTSQQLSQMSRAMKVEIGSVVWTRSFLAHESAPRCLLPRSLDDDFRMALARLAERNLRDSDQSSEKQPSSSPETTSPDAD